MNYTRTHRVAFRALMIVILIPYMIWNIGKTAVKEFRSFCWYTLWSGPRICWEEWINAFRRGGP